MSMAPARSSFLPSLGKFYGPFMRMETSTLQWLKMWTVVGLLSLDREFKGLYQRTLVSIFKCLPVLFVFWTFDGGIIVDRLALLKSFASLSGGQQEIPAGNNLTVCFNTYK